jgi:hypothetical protein
VNLFFSAAIRLAYRQRAGVNHRVRGLMAAHEVKELIELIAMPLSIWQSLWTTFYTVSAAIVALVTSGKILPKMRRLVSTIAALGFLIFAVGNYEALAQVREQRVAIVCHVSAAAADNPHIREFANASEPTSLFWLRFYHWGLCIFVLVLLFGMPAFQKDEDNKASTKTVPTGV